MPEREADAGPGARRDGRPGSQRRRGGHGKDGQEGQNGQDGHGWAGEPVGAPYACEEEAREALAAVAGALCADGGTTGTGGPAMLSLRWRRSGCEGFLAVAASAWQPAPDAEQVGWFTLEWPSARGQEVGRDPDSTAFAGSTEDLRLHCDLHRRQPETSAVVSWRPVFSTTLACSSVAQRDGIPTFHPDVTVAAGGTIRCARAGAPGSPALTDHVLAALRDRRACLMAGKGLLVIGPTLPAALGLSKEVESLAKIYCEVLRLHGKSPRDASDAADSADSADPANSTDSTDSTDSTNSADTPTAGGAGR